MFLPTLPSLLFHGPSKSRNQPRYQGSLFLTPQWNLGNEVAQSLPRFCDTRISSLSFNARFSCWWRSLSFTADLYRWHHHYFIIVVDSQYNWLYVKHFSSSARDNGSPDSSFISLEKGDKTASKLSEGRPWQTKSEVVSLCLLDFAVLTDAYLVHWIWHKEFSADNCFDPSPITFHTSASILHLVKDGHWTFFFYLPHVELNKIQHAVVQ